jgi:D-galactarolactone cycloisomerase
LYRFLGASEQRSIPCYATGFYFLQDDVQAIARDFAAEAEQLLARGFRAMKLKVGLGVENDLVLIATVRKAIGPEIRLMMDANHAYDPATAIDLGRRAEQYDLAWFEEPVTPLDPGAYLEVKRATRIPIAGGEAEYTRFGFEPLLRARALDYAQPDLCACGGISEGMKIATLASLHSVHVTPHAWGTAIGQAAALQFYAARPSHPATLVAERKWIECDQSENPLRYGIVKAPIELCSGEWILPQSPGLGIEVCVKE